MSKFRMQVPRIGGGNNQPTIDVSQAVKKVCGCGCDLFNKVYRVGLISKLAPGNKTNQDHTLEVPIFICNKCGLELNCLEGQGDANNDLA